MSRRAPIIDGRLATRADAPAVGAILTGRVGAALRLQCTGTLVAPDVVLTAAHCTEAIAGGPQWYFTRSLEIDEGVATLPADAVRVTRWVPHPQFRVDPSLVGLSDAHDLELMFLPSSLDQPLILARPSIEVAQGLPLTVVGYGRSSTITSDAGVMRIAESVVSEVATAELRVGAGPPQPCFGDSGGPAIVGTTAAARLLGVVSRGFAGVTCEQGAIAARVDADFEWIASEMVEACVRGDRVACADGGAPPEPAIGMAPLPDEGGCACVRGRSRSALPWLLAAMIVLMRGRHS